MKRRNSFRARRALPAAVLLAVTGFVVTACGGGSGSGSSAPQISAIPAQNVNQDTSTGAIAFTVSDDSGADAITLTATSSNTDIVAASGITLGGSGASRTITLVPMEDGVGSSTITITARDGQGTMNVTAFALNVKAVTQSFTTLANTAYAQMEGGTQQPVKGVTFTQDADETTFVPLLQ